MEPGNFRRSTWNNINLPNFPNFTLTMDSNLTFFVSSPNGQTLFAWDANGKQLYKSVNSGSNWSLTPADNGLNGKTVTALAISASDDNILVAGVTNTGDNAGNFIYRSINGGTSFAKLPPGIDLGAPIVALAYGLHYNMSDNICLIGTSDNTGGGHMYIWDTLTYAFTLQTGLTGGDCMAVAFSPDFHDDTQIFAVTATHGGNNTMTADTRALALSNWNDPSAAKVVLPEGTGVYRRYGGYSCR